MTPSRCPKTCSCIAASGADRYDAALIFDPGRLSEKEIAELLAGVDWTESTYSGSRFLKIESDSAQWFLTAIGATGSLPVPDSFWRRPYEKGVQEEGSGMTEGMTTHQQRR